MRKVTGTHVGETINADGADFDNCSLDGCVVAYSGEEFAINEPVRFRNCKFIFSEKASRTFEFLRKFRIKASDPVQLVSSRKN